MSRTPARSRLYRKNHYNWTAGQLALDESYLPPGTDLSDLRTPREVAGILGLSITRAYDAIANGWVQGYLVRGRLACLLSDVLALRRMMTGPVGHIKLYRHPLLRGAGSLPSMTGDLHQWESITIPDWLAVRRRVPGATPLLPRPPYSSVVPDAPTS